MGVEIERKFLVKNESFKSDAFMVKNIRQGYLNSDKNRTVRVRISNDSGYLTIKGKSNTSGTSRYEWEKKIDLNDASELLLLCEADLIEKERYFIRKSNHIFEVDVFSGANEGLLLAEIELQYEDEKFEKPDWLGEEVTGNKKYYNSALSKNAYSKWL